MEAKLIRQLVQLVGCNHGVWFSQSILDKICSNSVRSSLMQAQFFSMSGSITPGVWTEIIDEPVMAIKTVNCENIQEIAAKLSFLSSMDIIDSNINLVRIKINLSMKSLNATPIFICLHRLNRCRNFRIKSLLTLTYLNL